MENKHITVYVLIVALVLGCAYYLNTKIDTKLDATYIYVAQDGSKIPVTNQQAILSSFGVTNTILQQSQQAQQQAKPADTNPLKVK